MQIHAMLSSELLSLESVFMQTTCMGSGITIRNFPPIPNTYSRSHPSDGGVYLHICVYAVNVCANSAPMFAPPTAQRVIVIDELCFLGTYTHTHTRHDVPSLYSNVAYSNWTGSALCVYGFAPASDITHISFSRHTSFRRSTRGHCARRLAVLSADAHKTAAQLYTDFWGIVNRRITYLAGYAANSPKDCQFLIVLCDKRTKRRLGRRACRKILARCCVPLVGLWLCPPHIVPLTCKNGAEWIGIPN